MIVGIKQGIVWGAALLVCAVAQAQDGDLAAGEKLYVEQCKLCHGDVADPARADRAPRPSRQEAVHLALQQPGTPTRADVPMPMVPAPSATADARIAFAPPFGPNLRGVYGREAGSMPYEYSATFMKTLKGMVWNEAALEVWITNTQAWVPGVYMFYKQPDAEIRRKIILYLKANP